VTPVLTTNLRSTQTLDPAAGAARADLGVATVTAAAYPVCTTRPRAAATSALRPNTATGFANGSWSSIGLDAMPKVDFHDRWPLRSPS
jgi:hypothetical protein